MLDSIFGLNGQPGWGLHTMTSHFGREDFKCLLDFMSPSGPLFLMVYKLQSDQYLRYEFPVDRLPVSVHEQSICKLHHCSWNHRRMGPVNYYYYFFLGGGRGGTHTFLPAPRYCIFFYPSIWIEVHELLQVTSDKIFRQAKKKGGGGKQNST